MNALGTLVASGQGPILRAFGEEVRVLLTGEQPLRMLISTAPAGLERFFARCADEFGRPDGPDMRRIVDISAEHGIHFVEP